MAGLEEARAAQAEELDAVGRGRMEAMARVREVKAGLEQQLSQAGARVETLVQDTGHQLTSADLETTQRWLAAQESL